MRHTSVLATPVAEAAETPIKKEWTKDNLEKLVLAIQAKYELSSSFYRTLSCESAGFKDPAIQSGWYHNGIREESYGVAQINLPSHKDITKSQAIDPEWAVIWAAKEFKAGRQYQWSCWKQKAAGT